MRRSSFFSAVCLARNPVNQQFSKKIKKEFEKSETEIKAEEEKKAEAKKKAEEEKKILNYIYLQ